MLKWRKVYECELNQIIVDKQENRIFGFILDLLTAINRIFVPAT